MKLNTFIQNFLEHRIVISKMDISFFNKEQEGKEYDACNIKLKDYKIIYRTSKITPKKIGLFVTFWKRNNLGITAPYTDTDEFNFLIISAKSENKAGLFVFPKTLLIEKGIITTQLKDGKRGFRVYPSWESPTSKQALKTQNWQIKNFHLSKLESKLELKDLLVKVNE